MKSLLFLGRQPALGLAELESLYGSDQVALLQETIVASSLHHRDINFARLGGSIKLAKVLTTLDTPHHSTFVPEGKLTIGLSVYGMEVSLGDLQATALRIKKAIRATGRSVRIVPNQSPTLSSAQILHNGLTKENGWEIIAIRHGNSTILALAVAEQNIDAYAARDQSRPKRDSRVGMLPPKLAQMLINLGAADPEPQNHTILDPFCGTGVVLQEAALMSYNVYGSDIEPRMVDYSRANLEWLNKTHQLTKLQAILQTADATNHTWDEPFDFVACEGYLGQPFIAFPPAEKLNSVMHTCNQIAKEFLKNIHPQLKPGMRLCIALPAWHRSSGSFLHLKLLDQIEDLGYNRVSFVHVRDEDLLYYREDQVVARELLVITRK
jgi:tRNA G10  N-methylase Trm11